MPDYRKLGLVYTAGTPKDKEVECETVDSSPHSIKTPRHEPNASNVPLPKILSQDRYVNKTSPFFVCIDVSMILWVRWLSHKSMLSG